MTQSDSYTGNSGSNRSNDSVANTLAQETVKAEHSKASHARGVQVLSITASVARHIVWSKGTV